MESKINKMLRNVQNHWISIRTPAKSVSSKYKTLMVKMDANMTLATSHKVPARAKENFDLLANVEVLLSLTCFIPLLDAIYNLMKLSQDKDIFIYDYMQPMKVCQGELVRRFIDVPFAYFADDFSQYYNIVSLTSGDLSFL